MDYSSQKLRKKCLSDFRRTDFFHPKYILTFFLGPIQVFGPTPTPRLSAPLIKCSLHMADDMGAENRILRHLSRTPVWLVFWLNGKNPYLCFQIISMCIFSDGDNTWISNALKLCFGGKHILPIYLFKYLLLP